VLKEFGKNRRPFLTCTKEEESFPQRANPAKAFGNIPPTRQVTPQIKI